MLSSLLSLIFPKICFGCTREGTHFCEPCTQYLLTLRFKEGVCLYCGSVARHHICASCGQTYGLKDLIVGMSFKQAIIETIIHAWKFQGLRDLTAPLARLLTATLTEFTPPHLNQMIIVPMPMHWIRQRRRGYNQTELLANEIGRALELPIATKTLQRRWSPQQSKMRSAQERERNVESVFYCPTPTAIVGQHFLLLDDLTTSGATLAQAAYALRLNGAASVSAAVIAKG